MDLYNNGLCREHELKFEIKPNSRNISTEELITNLRNVAKQLGQDKVTIAQYSEHGIVDPTTIIRRFGSWQRAVARADLQAGKASNHVKDHDLFDNLRNMWIQLGRQPNAKEVKRPFSKYACNTYIRRFGSWYKALQEFIDAMENDETTSPPDGDDQNLTSGQTSTRLGRRTPREISDRLRFRILLRDGFTCTSCGSSPMKNRGVELHVDHVIPWSKGGETIQENLTTKCKKCNLGKGNILEDTA